MYSSDGKTWSYSSTPELNPWYSITYGNGLFVTVAYTGVNKTSYSTNAINWNSLPAGDIALFDVAYGNDTFVAVGRSGSNRVITANCIK
jgi:hypothetical protein